MCGPILAAGGAGLGVLGAGMLYQQNQAEKQAEKQQKALEQALRESKTIPTKPKEQAKFKPPQSTSTGQHRNIRMSGPFVPPSRVPTFGQSMGSPGSGKKLLGQ